jgi:Protein of unknown function (DUF4240)
MTWAEFWALIETRQGTAGETGCRRLAERLATRPVPEIAGFADRLSEAVGSIRRSSACYLWQT